MILDSSAVIAIVLQEPGYERLVEKVGEDGVRGMGTPNLVECGIVLSARLGRDARPLLHRLLQEFEVTTVSFGDEPWRAATDAWWRFGKGRHRAALDLGDCCAYATARLADRPLLCTGNDFAKTDLVLA